MPGRSARRFSIVGVQLKVVARWRSMTSTTWAASNRSMTTTWSPPTRLTQEWKPFMWYIGPSTRTTWGRGIGRHPSAIGMVRAGS